MTGSLQPIVLVRIDRDSRVHIEQSMGVQTAFLDERVDGACVVVRRNVEEIEKIIAAVAGKFIVSEAHDDVARTAAETLRRIATGEIVVAAGPTFPTPRSERR